MKRHISSWLTMSLVGALLAAGSTSAFAGKGFSLGGSSFGSSRGGMNISSFSGGNSFKPQIRNLQSTPTRSLQQAVSNNFSTSRINTPTLRLNNANPVANLIPKNVGSTVRQLNSGQLPTTNIQRQNNTGGNVPAIKKIVGNDVSRILPGIKGNVGQPAADLGKGPSRVLGNLLPGNVGKVVGQIGGIAPAGNAAPGGAPVGNIAPAIAKNGKSHCAHVIDLLIRNCVRDRSCYDPCIRHHCVDPIWVDVGLVPAIPVEQPVIGQPPVGDLELMAVGLVAEGSLEAGPIFAVTFRNNSQNNVQNFRISLVAVLGQIEPTSPTTTVTVTEIAAGETAVMQIQLPVTSMAMSVDGQQLQPFDTLVVAIDSFDEMIENNEANNVATLNHAEILAFVAEEEAAVAEEAPADQIEAPADEAPAVAPNDNGNSSPTDEIDLDSLDLTDAEGAAVRLDR